MNPILLEEKLKSFFLEDIGEDDLSSRVFPSDHESTATVKAKESGIAAGLFLFEVGYRLLDPRVQVTVLLAEGASFSSGDTLVKITGPTRSVLSGERVLLNLVQRMCSISTYTQACVKLLTGSNARLVDTRKTTAGLCMFEKYAVRIGGGFNHRNGLYDAVMLKDNHIAACGSITSAVAEARLAVGPLVKIEVEVETEAQLREAIRSNPDVIMIDNQSPSTIRAWRELVPPTILLEASGGITVETLAAYASSGVDFISMGALTHSVKQVDLSLNVTTSRKESLV
ncbi:nicotinate-nucleotide diphosphorylase (carboxylating) [Chryseomicrobium excrementi]|uniref:Probable nicotinate-nucleotide pyrophosphorylase [carboxylating] n=1 Tax=Chryseomicrobium excrementi TaxID=2041346 RepID=A0A2M9F0X6_9BACL|nr:carboxylating nicotinate-nucleotide diphosphorylase [Chryseomicrobium excrementi]PJK17114.1 nicotinate-nucleotide diphosphorylase (carboxylating) [Chryseomicrobium excrementi]